MASILDILNTSKGEILVAKASEKTAESKENVTGVLVMVLPILLGAMKRNISSRQGKESLSNALKNEIHGKEFLDNIQQQDSAKIVKMGSGILDHILGSSQQKIAATLGSTLGIKEAAVADIMKMAAPLLLSILSIQIKKEKIGASGFEELLNSLMGSSNQFDSSFIETLLDNTGDGTIINDVKENILGGGKNGKKDGGILGGMLGGK